MKRTPLRRVSKKRAKELRHYSAQRLAFLKLRPYCQTCHSRNLNAARATDVHHTAGRNGKHLNDEARWLAVCRPCHDHIHRHPGWARAMGFLV